MKGISVIDVFKIIGRKVNKKINPKEFLKKSDIK